MSTETDRLSAPLDRGFNCAVMHIASRLFPTGFDVADDAPSTLADLKAHVARTGRMVVWSGASDHTIFADPEVNYAFRAWHDWCHLKGNYDFTPDGEWQALGLQLKHLDELYGWRKSYPWKRILHAEVVGQLEYQAKHGDFPIDQMAFAREYLETGCV